MKTIYVDYVIGDFVILIDVGIRARVVRVTTVFSGSYYDVEWWDEEKNLKIGTFYESEMQLAPEDDE